MTVAASSRLELASLLLELLHLVAEGPEFVVAASFARGSGVGGCCAAVPFGEDAVDPVHGGSADASFPVEVLLDQPSVGPCGAAGGDLTEDARRSGAGVVHEV